MDFRDREKARQLRVARELFSTEALATPGTYKKIAYPFCLSDECTAENLWIGYREQVLRYFDDRAIDWHGGFKVEFADGRELRLPSGHICDSQCFCVNVWWPFSLAPNHLLCVLQGFGYPASEVLPISLDGSNSFVAFEWIGQRNYLGEGPGGRKTADAKRSRGKNATSADAMVRFRRMDGRVQIVLIEWKYTENYSGGSIRFSERGTDRLRIYQPEIHRADSPFAESSIEHEDLFFDPFEQLMRLQLLAAAMEREREMEADIVSVLHLAPQVNRELMNAITSPGLKEFGSNIHEVWRALVGDSRFAGRYVDTDVLPLVLKHAPDARWSAWMAQRYVGMM